MSLVRLHFICLVDRPEPRVGGRGWKERKKPQGGRSVGVSLHGTPGIANGIELNFGCKHLNFDINSVNFGTTLSDVGEYVHSRRLGLS
jgi:hypothetical protein